MKRVNAKEVLGDIHLQRPEELSDEEKAQLLSEQEAEEAKIDAAAGLKVEVGATDFRPAEKKQRMPRQPIRDIRPTALSEEMDQAAKKIFSFIHQDVAGGITEFMVTVRKREKKTGRYAYQAGSKIILRPQDEDIEDLYDRIYDNYGAGDYMITLRAPKKWADKGIKPETISFTIGNDSPAQEPVKASSITDDPIFMEMMGKAGNEPSSGGEDLQRLLLTEASKSQDALTRFLMMQLQTMQRQIAESNQKMLELSTKPNPASTQDPMAMVEKTLGLIMPLVTAAKSVSAPAGVDPMQQMTSMMGMFTQVMSLTDKIRGGKDISADGDKDEEPTTVKQKLTNSLVKGADTFVETMAKQLGEKMAPMAMSLAMGQGAPGLGGPPQQQQRRIATHKPKVMSVEEQQAILSDILNNTFAALKAGASNEEAMLFLSSKLKPNVIKAVFDQPEDVIKTSIKEAVPDLEDEKIDSFIKFIKGVNP